MWPGGMLRELTPKTARGSFLCGTALPTPKGDGDVYGFLLTLLVLDGVFLGVVILLQAGKGGGLAAMGGGAAATEVLGGRQATTLLTRATWIAGSGFMALALVLAIMSSRSAAPVSVLEDMVTDMPEPVLPGTEAPPSLVPSVEVAPADAESPSGEASAPSDGSEPPNGSQE